MKKYTILTVAFLLFGSTSFGQSTNKVQVQLENTFSSQSFFANHLTGFVLYNLDSKEVVFEKNSHLYQVSASTTKLLTLFAALVVLQDSTQTLRYTSSGDTLKIWGSGDPSWKYKELQQPDFQKIIGNHAVIQFSDANQISPPFGYGWQWDDYYYDYAAERSSLPIYGNLITVTKEGNSLQLSPNIFQAKLQPTTKEVKEIVRDFHSNTYFFNPNSFVGKEKYIPFKTGPELLVDLARRETGVTWIYSPDSLPTNHKEFRAAPISPILKEMMLISDNFLAEQTLLMVSDKLFNYLDNEKAIDYLLENELLDLPDRPKWVDGSGLSRHNLLTPRTLVRVVEKLKDVLCEEQLMEYLAVGGQSGTLKNSFNSSQPYIFAKTGSMSAVYNLAGLVKGKSGKTYAFAFMNSNFPSPVSAVRKEVEKVMAQIKDNF